jgi:hypothetical protein
MGVAATTVSMSFHAAGAFAMGYAFFELGLGVGSIIGAAPELLR